MNPTPGVVEDIKRRIYLFALALALPCLLLMWLYGLLFDRQNLFLLLAQPPLAVMMGWSIVVLLRRALTLERLERLGLIAMYLYALAAVLFQAFAPNAMPPSLRGLADLIVMIVAVGAFIVLPPRSATFAAGALYLVAVASAWISAALARAPQADLLVLLVRHLALLAAIGLTSLLAWTRLWWGQVSDSSARLTRLANTDPLTELPNRRGMYDVIGEAMNGAGDAPFCVVLADLDAFKSVNDTYGHNTGDEVLRRFADVLRHHLRDGDEVGRWGGEEYLLVLRRTTLPEARRVANRLRANIESTILLPDRTVTASFGVAAWAVGDSFDGVLGRADNALYRAKSEGKNRVACEDGVIISGGSVTA